jgi:hypothetical protein
VVVPLLAALYGRASMWNLESSLLTDQCQNSLGLLGYLQSSM